MSEFTEHLRNKLDHDFSSLIHSIEKHELPMSANSNLKLHKIMGPIKRGNLLDYGRQFFETLYPLTGEWNKEYGAVAFSDWEIITKKDVAHNHTFDDFLRLQNSITHHQKYHPGQLAGKSIYHLSNQLEKIFSHKNTLYSSEFKQIYTIIHEMILGMKQLQQHYQIQNHLELTYTLKSITLTPTTQKLLKESCRRIESRSKNLPKDLQFSHGKSEAKSILDTFNDLLHILNNI